MCRQATFKAEILELYTEMLNTREKSERQAALSAKMCRLEQPSLTVEAEPENVFNTASPGRLCSWILPSELMTPLGPTTGGVQTPAGQPIQYGPSPEIHQYSRRPDLSVPVRKKKDVNYLEIPCSQEENNQKIMSNKIYSWRTRTSCRLREFLNLQTRKSHPRSIPFDALRFVRPRQHDEETPSTACNSSTVSPSTPGGVRLGAAEPPCFGQPPGLVHVPSIPLPLPPPRTFTNTSSNAEVYPRQWTPLGAKSKTPPGGPPSGSNNQSTG